MAVPGGEDVYATLLLTDTYLPGALVLAHSLRDAGTSKKLAILVTLETVSVEVVTQLKSVYDYVIPVDRIRNENPANLYLMERPDLHSAFTKINLWKQTQFGKIVYIDADVVAYRAPDELFDLPHAFSAAPDIGWPDLFNTGVMVLKPDIGEYYALLAMAERGISFDGADQGLLNMHFKNNYNRLSFTYNVTPSAHYQYVPAYRHFQSTINMVHFIGADKPWFQGRDAHLGSGPFNEMAGRWWAVYDRHYRREANRTVPAISISTPGSTTTSLQQLAQQSQPTEQAPELVQYFVKGEYHPTVSYVVPVGEPSQGQGYHGQHYQTFNQQQSYEPIRLHQHYPDHPHHQEPHYSQSHDEQSHHDQPHSHSHDPSPQDHQHHDPHHQHQHHEHHQHHESCETSHGSHTETQKEQGHDHQQWTHHEPEHKPSPPPQQPTWDAQRAPPPAHSGPEAANFPEMHYEMSNDTAAFVPPQRYPSPPKDMWYEVPKEKPAPAAAPPRAIFPWETHRPRASRVFADLPPEPPVAEESKPDPAGESNSSGSPAQSMTDPSNSARNSVHESGTTSNHVTPPAADVWTSFTNAWDEVPQIERYVGQLQQKHRRTKSQNMSLGSLPSPSGLTQEQVTQRRGSKLTDFPTEVERPSLPVTPAPIRRPRFWGGGGSNTIGAGEEDEENELLPAAEGVPAQSEWDPMAQLQKLAQQQADLLLQKFGEASATNTTESTNPTDHDSTSTTGLEGRDIPKRPLPFGSEDVKSPTYVSQSPTVHSPQPVKPQGAKLVVRLQTEEEESTPQRTAYEEKNPEIEEPSYHGPGAAFEKGEEYMTKDRPALPTEEEQDVLET